MPRYNFFRVGAVLTGAYEWQSLMIAQGCMCGFNVVWLHEHSKNHGKPRWCHAKSSTVQDAFQPIPDWSTSSAAAGVTRRWGLQSHARVCRCWPYPCCAVGSAGVTGSGHWKQVERHEWLTIVMHQHVNLKYISEVIMYWIMHWNINLVLGKGCNISLMYANFSKHTLKNHSCLSIICLFQSLTMPILCTLRAHTSL